MESWTHLPFPPEYLHIGLRHLGVALLQCWYDMSLKASLELLVPAPQGLGIMHSYALDLLHDESSLRATVDATHEPADCWQMSAWEDILFDEVLTTAIVLIPRLGYRNALEEPNASILLQISIHTRKVRVEKLVSNMLDHLNTDNLVKRPQPIQLPIVFLHHHDPVLQSQGPDPRLRKMLLLAAGCHRCHSTSGPLDRLNGETAPSRADLKHVIRFLDPRRRDGVLQFPPLGILERLGSGSQVG